jgi:hypothetical protein
MNHLPRRPARVQPLQRGRSAAVPPLGQKPTPIAVVRQRPPISSAHSTIVKIVEKSACDNLHPDWIALYKKWPRIFKIFNRPWQWLVILVILISLSIMLGTII